MQAVKTKTCPMCGESILMSARKCKHCGEYLDAALKKATNQAYQWTTGRIILLIIGLIGLGVLFYSGALAALPTLLGK